MEKRRHQRIRKRWLVKIMAGASSFQSFTYDVSSSGLFLLSPKTFAPGVPINMEISLEQARVKLNGRVVWARSIPAALYLSLKGGMGVRIEGGSMEDFFSLLRQA